jgi:hypothetical protein
MYLEQYHDLIKQTRETKAANLQTYAEIMQQLVQPAIEKALFNN